MKSKPRKTSEKVALISLSAAVAIAMGASSGIASASTTDLQAQPLGLTVMLIDDALLATADNKDTTLQTSKEYIVVAKKAAVKKKVTGKKKAAAKKKYPAKKRPPVKKKAAAKKK